MESSSIGAFNREARAERSFSSRNGGVDGFVRAFISGGEPAFDRRCVQGRTRWFLIYVELNQRFGTRLIDHAQRAWV